MELGRLDAQQAQQDVQAVGLLLGLGEEHHVVLEGPGHQGWNQETITHTRTHTHLAYCTMEEEQMLTCYDGLTVPLPVGSDPDKLLTEERGYIRVAVHEDPDGLLQGH